MATLNRAQLSPPYPAFNEFGYRPKPAPFGPPDVWPSGHQPGYPVYAGAYGRNLAGVDDMNSEGIEVYPNELDSLSLEDDVMGNGVFDPNDTHGNIHAHEGVFQDHQSLPGYVARDHFYTPSEVNDVVGGGKTMYVPGGAVSFQQGQPETYRKQRLLWELPPDVSPVDAARLPQQSTFLAPTPAYQVRGIDGLTFSDGSALKNPYVIAAGVGIAVGIGFILWKRSK